MNKKLLAVFSLLASMTMLAACGGGETSNTGNQSTGSNPTSESVGGEDVCDHTGATEVKFDETNHWTECECGEKLNVTAHTINGGSDETHHWGTCECGYEAEKVEHSYNVAKSDAEFHWNECACGKADEKVAHTFNTPNYDEMKHWNECECGEKTDINDHVAGDDFYSTEEGHWNECDCGFEMNKEVHEGDGEWVSDETSHWQYCECGWEVEKADHQMEYTLEDDVLVGACECGVEANITESITYFDRLNKNIVKPDGTLKNNNNNYWDGDKDAVTVEKVDDGMKVGFSYSALTAEQQAAVGAGKMMWVAYTIPVGGVDVTNLELVLDMKMDNMNKTFVVYAVSDYEGDELDAVYAFGNEITAKAADAKDLGDGWYRYTIALADKNNVAKAADYIALSFDNTAADVNKDAESIVYIKNVVINNIVNYTVTVDGEEETVRKGASFEVADPEKDGFEFLGWVDAEGNEVQLPITVTGDVTLIPQWKKLPIAVGYNETKVDIDLTKLSKDEDYEKYSFTAPAGTYDIVLSGGLRAFTLENDVMVDEITQFVFEEETTVVFAITFSEDLDMKGAISIVTDPTVGLDDKKAIVTQIIKDGWGATAPERAWQNGSTAAVVTEGIPDGYSSVLRLDWYQQSTSLWKVGGNPFYRGCYNQDDISGYTVVRFGLKLETDGDAVFEFANNAKVSNEWIFFQLAQTSANVWTLTVSNEEGDTVFAVKNLVRFSSGLTDVDSIASLVFPADWDAATSSSKKVTLLKPCSSQAMTASVYMTEAIGYREKPDYSNYDPQIPAEAVKVRDSIWRSNNYALSATTSEPVPNGFTNVKEYDWLGNTANGGSAWGANNKGMPLTCLDEAVVSGYTDVFFAIKTTTPNGIYVQGGNFYRGGEWLYAHYSRAADGTWSLSLKSPDGYVANNVQTGLTGESLNVLMSWAGAGVVTGKGFYPDRTSVSEEAIVWFTDMWAIEKPYDPAISEDANELSVIALKNVTTNEVKVIEDCSDVKKANGFEKVYGVQNVNWTSSALPWNNYNTDTDISVYSELWFAFKLVNARFAFPTFNPTVNDLAGGAEGTDWIYFHATKNVDGKWTIEVTYKNALYAKAENQVASTLENLLYDDGYSTTDGGAFVIYQYSGTDIKLYTTEVLAVFETGISEDATQVLEHIYNGYYFGEDCGAVTGGSQSAPDAVWSEEVAPKGFSKVIECDWSKAGSKDFGVGHFNTMDLSGYSDVYFAMKVEGEGSAIYVQGKDKYFGGEWVYVHLSQADDGTWTKSVRTVDGYNYANVHTGITGNTLSAMLPYGSSASTGTYPTKDENGTAMIYFTELLGVQKA